MANKTYSVTFHDINNDEKNVRTVELSDDAYLKTLDQIQTKEVVFDGEILGVKMTVIVTNISELSN